MNKIKTMLLSNWDLMRVFRLALGIFIAVEAIRMQDYFSGAFAAFFLFQAVTNTGCCASSTCNDPYEKNKSRSGNEIVFEEVRINKDK